MPNEQRYRVVKHNLTTGETWEVDVDAAGPTDAVSKVLRRRLWANDIAESDGDHYSFEVHHA